MDTIKQYQNIPAVISMSAMAKLLNISRSRLYQLIDEDIILRPAYLLCSRKPMYTNEMATKNLEVKRNNTGINGKIVMFYSARKVVQSINNIKPIRQKAAPKDNQYTDLIEQLKNLGLEDISQANIVAAISELFPTGVNNINEDEILTSVFRHIKRQNSEHKPRT